MDLLVITGKMICRDKLASKKKIFPEIEEQKIDILLFSKKRIEPFVKMIFDRG